jgi:hypothetical protein
MSPSAYHHLQVIRDVGAPRLDTTNRRMLLVMRTYSLQEDPA